LFSESLDARSVSVLVGDCYASHSRFVRGADTLVLSLAKPVSPNAILGVVVSVHIHSFKGQSF
jgi:hypothetical protein